MDTTVMDTNRPVARPVDDDLPAPVMRKAESDGKAAADNFLKSAFGLIQ